MTTEDKFNAAVNVIRSLPKNGSYQPSNELMLRFYSYFKQATQGPCCGSRPPFWDVVGRAKYDAWKKLGDMSKNDAMTKYVDELHSIVETMSYSDKVANFLEAPTNELDGINMDDLELVAGDVIEKVRSQPNSPLTSREGSPIRFISNISSSRSSLVSEDHSDDEYRDTIDLPNQLLEHAEGKLRHMQEINIPNGDIGKSRKHNQQTIDISKEIAKTIDSLKGDIQRLTNQVNALELAKQNTSTRPKNFFQGIGNDMAIFIIVWPFIASFIVGKWVLRNK